MRNKPKLRDSVQVEWRDLAEALSAAFGAELGNDEREMRLAAEDARGRKYAEEHASRSRRAVEELVRSGKANRADADAYLNEVDQWRTGVASDSVSCSTDR